MNALPAYLQNKSSRGLAQTLVGNLGAGSPPFLSIMGNRLTLIDAVGEEIPVSTYDPKTGPYIDCVIMDALERTSKIFYDKPYDPSAAQYEPPPCFSDNGIGPSRNAAKPQSRTCAECPNASWGSKVSAVSGKGVKACSDIQKVAILVPGFEMPFLLRIPPNSRTNFRNYVHKFAGQAVDVCDVTTRICFEQGSIGTLSFAATAYIDEATFGQREKLTHAKATDVLIGRTDLPRQEALPAPGSQTVETIHQTGPAVQHQPQQTATVQQPAPFVPAQPAGPAAATPAFAPSPNPSATSTNPNIAAPAGGATAASPSEQPARRRRRTNAEIAAATGQAQAPAATAQPNAQAPFMAAPQAQGATASGFGMQAGAQPNPELAAALDGLFGPAR